MMIPPGFSFFQHFDFSGYYWGKTARSGPKQPKMSVALLISGTIHHIIDIFGTKCKMIISPGFFSFFKSFDFLGC